MFQSNFEEYLMSLNDGSNKGSCHEGAVKAQNLRLAAATRAEIRLKQEGRGYPNWSPEKTHLEHHDEVLAYGELLAQYTMWEMGNVN